MSKMQGSGSILREDEHTCGRFFFGLQLFHQVLIIAVLPLVFYIHASRFYGGGASVEYLSINGFTFYKSVWLIFGAFFSVVFYLLHETYRSLWVDKYLFAFAYLTILSTIFSPYPEIAIWGQKNQNEGLLTVIGYIGVCFIFSRLPARSTYLKAFCIITFISATALSLIGLMQFFRSDPLLNGKFVEFFTPEYSKQILDGIKPVLTEENWHGITCFFGNGNYAGCYFSMLFAFSFILFTFLEGRARIITGFLNILFFMNLLGSKSRAAMIATFVALLIVLLISNNHFEKKIKSVVIVFVLASLAAFAMDYYTLKAGNPGLFSETISKEMLYKNKVEGLSLTGKSLEVKISGAILKILSSSEGLEFYDENGTQISYKFLPGEIDLITRFKEIIELRKKFSSVKSPDDNHSGSLALGKMDVFSLIFPKKHLPGFKINVCPEHGLVQVKRGDVSIFVQNTAEGFKLLDKYGQDCDVRPVESFGFRGFESFGSGRGYIWSRTLPLLKKTVFLGYGPDTFIEFFPNHDCIGKLLHLSSGLEKDVDKPHSFYLQTALHSGCLSLFVLFGLFFRYINVSIKVAKNSNLERFEFIFSRSVFAGILAYLIAMLFNDGVVSVAPIFWSFLGLGILANEMCCLNDSVKIEEQN